MILPLWNGVSELEILAQLAGRPKPQGPALVQETFAQTFDADPEKWNSVLRVGFAPGSEWPAAPLSFSGTQADSGNEGRQADWPRASSLSFSKATAWTTADTRTIRGFRKLRILRPRSPGTMSRSLVPRPPRSSASAPTILARSTRWPSKWATTSISTSLPTSSRSSPPRELPLWRPLMSRRATRTIRSPWRWDMAEAVFRRSLKASDSMRIRFGRRDAQRFLTGVEVKVTDGEISSGANTGAPQHGGPRSVPRRNSRTLRA